MKSKLYQDVKNGKTTLKELFENGVIYLHKDKKTFEYVHFWNWSEKVKKDHPNLNDYEIRALTFNGDIICKGRVINYDQKYNGFLRWSYPDKKDEILYNELLKTYILK